MAGEEGKRVMGRCTEEQKAATQRKSATDGEPMEAARGDAFLKRKAQEEIHPHPEQDLHNPPAARELSIDEILLAAVLPKRADVASVAAAAAVEATEPMVVDLAKAAVSEPQAESGFQEVVSEPQAEKAEAGMLEVFSEKAGIQEAECTEDYQAEDDYEDDADYDYESDYEEEEYDYGPQFDEERPKVRAALLSFPEAANLEPHELDAAVERVLEQSKPEYADVAAPGKIRLLSEDIKNTLDTWMPPPPSALYDQAYMDGLPADSRKRTEEMEKEYLPLYGKGFEEFERFRAKIRRELIEKGYVEVDEDYYDKRDEFEERMTKKLQEEWDQAMDFSRVRPVANSEDGICHYSEEHGGYI